MRRVSDLINADSPPPSPRSTMEDDFEAPPASEGSEGDDGIVDLLTRKRPLEDPTTIAKQAARNVRFKPGSDGENAIVQFAQLSTPVQLVTIYAHLHAVSRRVEQMDIPNAVWDIPNVLAYRIERAAFSVIASPKCAAYIEKPGPLALVIEHLEENPSWGYTTAVKNDKNKSDMVVRRTQKALTTRRNTIKTALKDSLGSKEDKDQWDIVVLANAVLNSGESVMDGARLVPSLPILARFAFLRQCMVEAQGDPNSKFVKDFWRSVDSSLKEIRQTKQTNERISRFFASVLEEDMKVYGDIDRTKLANVGDEGLDDH